jgi:hypothetical protein
MKATLLIALFVATLFADAMRPRGSSSDYPAHQTAGGITVAAAVIPPDQVKKLFATDLNRAGYVVVEVGIYLDPGRSLTVTPGDFLLQIGTEGNPVRPVSAQTIASIYEKKTAPPEPQRRGPAVTTSSTIGYENGRYDPNTGRRTSGVYTESGVGVGTDNPRGSMPPVQQSSGRDPRIIEQELDEKALPEGDATHSIAGYLYFPKSSAKQKNAAYEITFYGSEPKIHLTIPPAK